MPIIVPVEENKVGLATATDARFRAPDYSGSGLEALGAGLARLGEGGAQFASALDEKRKQELAAAVAAAKLDDDHQRHIDDAAVKKAYVDYSDLTHEALHGDNGLFKQPGAGAHAAFPDVVAKLADNHDEVLSKLDEVQRGAIAPVLGARLRSDVETAADHVRAQAKAEQEWQVEKLKQAALRDAVASLADLERHDHHMATGENATIKQGRIKNLPDKEVDRQVSDFKSAVHAATIDKLIETDPVHAAGWYARNADKLNEVDRKRVEAKVFGAATRVSVDPDDVPLTSRSYSDIAEGNDDPTLGTSYDDKRSQRAGTSASDLLDPATLASLQAAANVESQQDGASTREAVSPEGAPAPGTRPDADGRRVSRALLRPRTLAALERQALIEDHHRIAAPPVGRAAPSPRPARPAHRAIPPAEVPTVHVDGPNVSPGRQPGGAIATIASSPGLSTGKRAVTKHISSPLAQAMRRIGRDGSYDHAFWGEFRPTPNDEDDFALIGKPDPNYRPPPKAQWGRISASYADQKIGEDALELVALGALTGMDEVGILEYFGIPKKWAMASMGLLKPALDLGEEGFKKRLWNTYFNMAYITLRQGGQVSVNEDAPNLGPD